MRLLLSARKDCSLSHSVKSSGKVVLCRQPLWSAILPAVTVSINFFADTEKRLIPLLEFSVQLRCRKMVVIRTAYVFKNNLASYGLTSSLFFCSAGCREGFCRHFVFQPVFYENTEGIGNDRTFLK